jgi:hypothetical protein
MADPNWLYSTAAQSGAAIVAIIGGFLSARLLGLQSEKASLQHEVEDKRGRIEILERKSRGLYLDEHRLLARGALRPVARARRFGQPFPKLDELIARREFMDIEPAILEEELSDMAGQAFTAEKFVGDHGDSIDVDSTSFNDWVAKVQDELNVLGDTLDVDALEEAFYRLKSKLKKQRRTQWHPGVLAPIDFSDLLRPRNLRRPGEPDPLDLLREEAAKLEAELSMTREETRVLEERLGAFAYPPNLWFGLIALVYLAVGGVIIPLFALPRDSNPAALKIAVLTLFVSGLAAVFAFLASQVLGITGGTQEQEDGTSPGLKQPK